MKTLAVIPTRYEPDRLRPLAEQVWREVNALVILDNGHEEPLGLRPEIRVVPSEGLSIYGLWNRAWATATHEGFDFLTLLNDDVQILPGTLPRLASTLAHNPTIGVAYPDKYKHLLWGIPAQNLSLDVVRDPAPERTLTGFCFTSRVAMFAEPPFDEKFHWWCGDDAFDRKVREAGYGVARVVGLPIEHESDAEANDWARRPELRHLADQDLARWNAL